MHHDRPLAAATSRREFLKRAAIIGGGLIAAGCQPAAARQPAVPPADLSASQSGEWERLLEAARREGEVNLYGGQGGDNRNALVAPFENAYPGIRVSGVFAPGRDLVVRIQAERTAGRNIADVLIGPGASGILPLKPVGALLPLEPILVLPEVTDRTKWLENKLWFLDAEPPYTTLGYVGIVQATITINTQEMSPTEFRSLWDLTDPKWKGKIVSTDVRTPGAGAVQTRYWYTHPELGPRFMEKLFGEMDVTLSTDQRQMIDWVAQGRFPVGILLNSPDVVAAADLGLPIALLPGDQIREGAPIGVSGGTVSAVEGGPHPNATKVYINWLLSRDGQVAWQRFVRQNSLRNDIPKDTVPQYTLPKPGAQYVNTATEDYATLSGGPITDLINRVLR